MMNSTPFKMLIGLFVPFGSYEIGAIRRVPLPLPAQHISTLESLAGEAYDLQRSRARGNEVSHAFGLPHIVRLAEADTLRDAEAVLEAEDQRTDKRLMEIQDQIDEIVFDLYEMDESDRAAVRKEMSDMPIIEHQTDLTTRAGNLLMWCVGAAFGRWDVRKALDPSRLPALSDPFAPLPCCAPGALVGDDGLPLPKEDLPEYYPLSVAWDGILADDPTHPSDIVSRVQQVLDLLWEDRAPAIQREICEILGVDRLRDYFRDARSGFFAFHAKRYSKSRRKAPIYWLLQSNERHYAIWLYYHRLDTNLLYAAGREYADAKAQLEQDRLEQLQQDVEGLEGSARRRRQREIERQIRIVEDVTGFRDKLDKVALLDLEFDLNDGVLLNIAPLRELVPWTYADRTWKQLRSGKYGWSSMAKQLRKLGLVEAGRKR
jgi:hypothetical protein